MLPAPVILPTLTLTGSLAFTTSSTSGTLVANIGNVPAGVTPTLTPNDGRLAIAGSAGAWTVVVGLTAANAGTFILTVLATGANSAAATLTVSASVDPVVPAIQTPMTLGMNSAGAGASGTEFFMRDLSRHGRYIVQGGASNGQDLDPSLIDFDTYFPISLPSGATGVILAITDGAWIGPMGTYAWTIDNRFTVTSSAAKDLSPVTDTDIVFTGSAGSGQVAIGGIPRRSGWSLTITGPFSSLTAEQRGLKILPLGDTNPERLYSDMWRSALLATGTRYWRPMEDLRANYFDAIQYMTDKGAQTGLPSATVQAIVQGCNDLNLGLTWNFHAGAGSAYVSRVCTYVAANLKKGLTFKVEYGNEPWNEAFLMANYMRHQAWIAGYAASGGVRPACVGWTTSSFVGNNTPFWQPFDPGTGVTSQAFNAGDYIAGIRSGYGQSVWRSANNIAAGATIPALGDANFVLVSDGNALNTGKWHFYADKVLNLYQTAQAAWVGAGHASTNCRPVINMQAGPYLGNEKEVLDQNSNALWSANPSIQQAPYWYTFLGDDIGTAPTNTTLDSLFTTDKADVELKQHWVRDRRIAIKAAAPGGITLGDDCHEIYEWNHHNIFSGTNRFTVFNAYRRDARIGMLLKYGLTLHAADNPGALMQIFNLVTGEALDTTQAWGVYFYASEAQSTPANPEGIALKEWFDASVAGKPSLDIFCKTAPSAGTQTVTILRGPQLTGAISGILRATGGASFDLPFTLAAGSPAVNVTYTAVAGQSLTFNIVPQVSVFSVGANSVNIAVTTAGVALMPNIVWRSNANGLSSTDGAAIAMPVVVGGTSVPATTGSATYVANAANSKPGIRFGGSAVHTVVRADHAPFFNAIDSQNWTGYIAFTNSSAQDALDCFLQINDDLDAIRLNRATSADASCGYASNGIGLNHLTTLLDSGVHVLGIQSRTASISAGGQTGSGRTLVTLDGLPIASYINPIPKTGAKNGTGNSFFGAFYNGAYGANVTLLDAAIYAENHSLAQMWDNTKYFRTFYGLGMASKILLVDGSSLKGGVTADAQAWATANEITRQCGLAYGVVGTTAIGGITYAGMREKGGELDAFLSRLGAANCYLLAGEGYNELVSVSATTAAANAVTYLNERVAAGWLPANIYVDTITGATSARPGYDKFADYATAVKAIPGANAGLSAVKIINTAGNYSDNDSLVGVGNTTLVTDGVHLNGKPNYPTTVSGYPRQVAAVYKTPITALGLG
ncbi:MAG TPA: hypothetical protein VF638_00765 [Sphingomonas sp.]